MKVVTKLLNILYFEIHSKRLYGQTLPLWWQH